PEGTNKSYKPEQKEWKEWCTQNQYADGHLVTEAKLLRYLQQIVVPRGNKKFKTVNGVGVALSSSSIDGYVKAITDLYKTQAALGNNRHSHPRGKFLTTYL
ncbi:hypothetical protein DFJ77DRAFT_422022, partial [Powellomyces hirtus]